MISIIVPFYNTEKYLEECLTSIRGQTFSDYECLMIDDGSTDSSRSIAEKYLDDPRFKLLGDKHIGFPYSKNLGLDNARGEYICFVDSDDFILPTYLESLYRGITENNSDLCRCNFARFTNDCEPVIRERDYQSTTYTGDKKIKCLFSSSYMWDKIYKRELFNNIRFENVMALSDTMVMYKIFDKAKSISIINQVLICYRVHNENMTYHVRNFEPAYWEHRLNVHLDMIRYLLKRYPNLRSIYKCRLISEVNFIKQHLDEEILNKYLIDEDIKKLLK